MCVQVLEISKLIQVTFHSFMLQWVIFLGVSIGYLYLKYNYICYAGKTIHRILTLHLDNVIALRYILLSMYIHDNAICSSTLCNVYMCPRFTYKSRPLTDCLFLKQRDKNIVTTRPDTVKCYSSVMLFLEKSITLVYWPIHLPYIPPLLTGSIPCSAYTNVSLVTDSIPRSAYTNVRLVTNSSHLRIFNP